MAVSAFHVTVCSPLIECDELAVDDRVVRHLRESLHNARIRALKSLSLRELSRASHVHPYGLPSTREGLLTSTDTGEVVETTERGWR
jgi:hypothetical protein